jgi:hypothetical protein
MSLALRLTLLLLLLRPVGSGWLRPSLLSLAVAGLLLPGALRHPALWLALALLAAWRVVSGWPLADNHAYLLAYWCLAVALALRAEDPQRALAWNGRALVGLAFALATLWKLLSPDYLDGRFFRVALVEDRRLERFATALGGIEPDALRARREFLAQHVAAAGRAVEAAVAAAFLAPLGRRVWPRHALLLLFCATTYAIAPVASFGWLLLAMGAAQCEPDARRTRAAYLAVFVMLIFTAGPWRAG